MTHFEYITRHLFRAWLQSWTENFRNWVDLLTNNYSDYVLSLEDDPCEVYCEIFWESINTDNTVRKEFLEYLFQKMNEVEWVSESFANELEE